MIGTNSFGIDIRTSTSTGRRGLTVVTAAVHPIVDGRDIIAEAFAPGPGHEPERLLSADRGLRAGDEPREVELAEAECTWGCCGALCTTVERVGDHVLWHSWRDRNGPAPELPDFRFDARRYDAEVARAEQDHSWEWPARTTARLLGERLRADAAALERWRFGLISASSWRPGTVDVLLGHPTARASGSAPWLQFRKELIVTDEDPAVQAARFARELTEHDPRSYADLCGGSADSARALGFPWPPPRR
ncbi:hypothetical protein ACWCYY_12420 [Kitasatospora sp. NPDC001664]